jgi:hypothetical protein
MNAGDRPTTRPIVRTLVANGRHQNPSQQRKSCFQAASFEVGGGRVGWIFIHGTIRALDR